MEHLLKRDTAVSKTFQNVQIMERTNKSEYLWWIVSVVEETEQICMLIEYKTR